MKFKAPSPKQLEILKFAHEDYPYLLADGAVRTGKSSFLMIGFIEWAMNTFSDASFGICGKSVTSAERNLIVPLTLTRSMMKKYQISYSRYDNLMVVKRGEVKNFFWVFGGKDEASYQTIQGVTLSGVLLDEVVLMPKSFVNQAIARTLSVDDAKVWMSCNPSSPSHWFYTDWVQQIEEKNIKYLHFTFDDNPAMSEYGKQRAEQAYTGAFHTRYVRGEWCKQEGLVYECFDPNKHVIPASELPERFEKIWIPIDYGTKHKRVYLKIGLFQGVHYVISECVYDGSRQGVPTVGESYQDLQNFAGDDVITQVILDNAPIAASFNEHIRRKRDYHYRNADNEVLRGIEIVHEALNTGILKVSDVCTQLIAEFGLYSYDDKALTDAVIKENDDACDCLRYYCATYSITRGARQRPMDTLKRDDDTARRIRGYKNRKQ